jgi:hypothetical protein
MISKHKTGSVNYMSTNTQNESIGLLGNKVQIEIISELKKAKHLSMLFDCTPDFSHQEQISQIIRNISVTDKRVSIKKVL